MRSATTSIRAPVWRSGYRRCVLVSSPTHTGCCVRKQSKHCRVPNTSSTREMSALLDILDSLRTIATVTAIRGNIDEGGPCHDLPPTELVELGGHTIYMLHDAQEARYQSRAPLESLRSSSDTRISRSIEWRRGMLFLNPGSAGPRRFQPSCYGRLARHRSSLI